MVEVLQPVTDDSLTYTDDIIIFSNYWAENLTRSCRVLQLLWEAGVTANPRKCCIAWTWVQYLGFMMDNCQVRA